MTPLFVFILVMTLGVLPLAILVYYFKYKDTIIFKTSFAILITTYLVSIASFIIGKYGLIHLIWFVPAGYIFLLIGNTIYKKYVQKPVKRLSEALTKLKQGDLNIEIEKVNNRFKDEIDMMKSSLEETISELKHTAEFAKQVGDGVYDKEIELLGEKDELRSVLMEMRDKLKNAADISRKQKIEEDKRKWVNEGLAKLNEILRQNDDVEEISFSIISYLVNYLDANQGGIFIRNTDNEDSLTYDLKAAYAYSRRKYMEKSFELGEGLIGNCAIEKKTTYMTEIPDNYIEIKSGLGESNPRSLLLVPMKMEEEVLGIIEIASFNEIEKHQREFIEQASLSIASTLNMTETAKKTSELLERTQQQAEEMAAQEEEMRQNLEELQATQEESSRKSEEVEKLLEETQEQAKKMEEQVEEFQEREVVWQIKLKSSGDKIKELEEKLNKKK